MQRNQPKSSAPSLEWAFVGRGIPQYWVWLAICFVSLYFFWYFWQPIHQGIRRLDLFVGLLLPFELLQGTIGNGLEHLEVGFADRLTPLSIIAFWFTAAWWIGLPSVQLFSSRLSRLESWLIGCLFGLSLLSTTTVLLGLCGWLNRLAIIAAVAVLSAVSFALQKHLKSLDNSALAESKQRTTVIPTEYLPQGQLSLWLWRLVPVGVVMLGSMYVATGWMPPLEFDVIEYHLQGPKEFFQQGRISFLEHNVYANMPLGIEMHALAAMVLVGGEDGWWLGGIAGNGMTGMFSLIAAGIAGGYAARYFGRSIGWATSAAMLSAPANIMVSGCGLIDSALGAYVLAMVVCLQLWRENRELQGTASSQSASLIVASFFAGTAAACKYTGFVFACAPLILLVLIAAYRELRQGNKPSAIDGSLIKLIAASILVCFLSIAPWLIKNAAWTGNPVYPLAAQVFGAGNLTEEQIQRWNGAHQTPRSASGSAYDWPSLRDSLQNILGKGENSPAVLIPFIAIGLLVSRSRLYGHPTGLPLVMAGWILMVWWMATHRIDRFWLPCLPLLSIVAATGMRWLLIQSQSAFLAFCLLITLTYACLTSINGYLTDRRWFVSYQSLRRDDGADLSEGRLPGRLPRSIGWINANLPGDCKLLSLGEARAFHFERQLIYATCFNTPPGEDELRRAPPEEQSNWLAQNGVTHILVQWSELDRYRSPGNYGFSSWPQRQDIAALIANGVARRVSQWPIDPQQAELLEVIRTNQPTESSSR